MIDRLYGHGRRWFRPRRMAAFLAAFEPAPDVSILDVGGVSGFWRDSPLRRQVTLLNPRDEETDMHHVVGDGLSLPFAGGAFDIVFSNSVIEHVGSWSAQQVFAAEARRVGRALWVQTPARSFPIEPHLLTPFVHWLPWRPWWLLRYLTVWGWIARPDKAYAEAFAREVRMLTAREMHLLFPDCQIRRERVAGLTKSFIAIRTAGLP